MFVGRVKSMKEKSSFGFIAREGGADIFFHKSELMEAGTKRGSVV